ncbi:DUF4232 domain-containing protein [Streptomyces sp. NPDC003233]
MTIVRSRRTAATLTSLFASCMLLTACQSGGGSTGAAPASASADGGSSSAASPSGASPSAVPAGAASRPASPAPLPASHGTTSATPACAAGALTPSVAHRLEPNPDHTYGVLLNLANSGSRTCLIEGFPTVAIAGQGDPTRSRPLKVTPEGTARPVRLAPGARAYLMLTFHEVMGEADGYCLSGATPAAPPSLVVGAAGGRFQVEMGDGGGNFAECDDIVRTTAFLPNQP